MNNLSDISGSEVAKSNRRVEGTDLNKIPLLLLNIVI